MSTIEYNVSVNPPNWINGIMYVRMKTRQTTPEDPYLHPTLDRVLGSLDPHFCISYLQRPHQPVRSLSSLNLKITHRALWFPRSWNCGRNRGIGQLKRNLLFNAEYRGIWHNFTEMLFSCGRGTFVWGKLHGGNQIWVAQQVAAAPLPQTDPSSPSKQCKHGEAAAHGSVFVGEKAEKLDIYPSVQSRAVPERLVCVRWTVVLQRSRPEKS